MAVTQQEALEKLNRLFSFLRERVPFYRQRLPERLSSLEEMAEVPFTVKEDFRDNYPFGLVAIPMEQVVRLHMSSGTTGKPVVTAYSRSDLEVWGDCMERVLRQAAVDDHDVLQNAYGYGLFTGGLGFHIGAERVGCTIIPSSSGVTQRQVMLMHDLGSTILCATPSYALVLAEAVAQEESRHPLQLRAGFFGAEPWTDGMRGQIEAGLGLEAFDIYGLTELGGPGVGVECRRHDGLHIFDDHFFIEVVEPGSGRPLPAGAEGELVLTSLTRHASPVVRYRTRDRTVLIDEPCRCGSPYPRIAKLRGRTDDMLIVRGVNLFPSTVEEILLAIRGLSGNYQLVVDRTEQRHETLQVLVEAAGAGGDHDALERTARERIKETIGLTFEVTVLPAGVLPRSEGKARRVIDRRDVRVKA